MAAAGYVFDRMETFLHDNGSSSSPSTPSQTTPQTFDRFIATGAYGGDYWPTAEWRTRTPEAVGMGSVSKSLLGAAIGVAVSRGDLPGLDRPVYQHLDRAARVRPWSTNVESRRRRSRPGRHSLERPSLEAGPEHQGTGEPLSHQAFRLGDVGRGDMGGDDSCGPDQPAHDLGPGWRPRRHAQVDVG